MTEPRLLFRTVHGSHLYGLAHPNSDLDLYEVWDHLVGRREAAQSIVDGVDTTRVSMRLFMAMVGNGVPQAVEALFAPDEAVQVDQMRWLRSALVPGTAAVAVRYARTLKAFQKTDPTPKRLRHAARLAHDRDLFLETGRLDVRAFSRTAGADLSLYC